MIGRFFGIVLIGILICLNAPVQAAAPSMSSHTGTFGDGNILTVSGSNFGNIPSPDAGDFFDDYTQGSNACISSFPGNIWCVNGDGQGDPTNGSKWSWDGNADLFQFFTGDGTTPAMNALNINPLLRMSSSCAMYSTGYGAAQSAEYKSSSSGGAKPNSGFYFSIPGSPYELYLVYYIKWDSNWDSDWSPIVQEKQVLIYLASGCKNTIELANHSYGATRINVIGECGDVYGTIDAPSSAGNFPGPNKWTEIKLYMKMDSSTSANDGVVKLWVNGQIVQNDSTVDLCTGCRSPFSSIHILSNLQNSSGVFTMPGSGNELSRYLDDVLIWGSYQSTLDSIFPIIPTVYLSNNSTWGTGPTDKLNGDTNFIRQKVGGTANADLGFKSWNTTQFKFSVNRGSLNFSNPVYLYVTNWNGQTNSQGFKLSAIGGGDNIPPKAPTLHSLL